MEREQLTRLLKDNFIALNEWITNHDDSEFEVSKREGKWTTGQHIDHLIRSTAPVTMAYRLPKLVLKWKFGLNNRSERSYEETYEKYIAALKNKGVKAGGRFVPADIKNADKSQKIMELKCQGKKFIKAFNKQSEENLSKYIVPHPAIGYMTFREIAYFTAFHTAHHHDILKKFH